MSMSDPFPSRPNPASNLLQLRLLVLFTTNSFIQFFPKKYVEKSS